MSFTRDRAWGESSCVVKTRVGWVSLTHPLSSLSWLILSPVFKSKTAGQHLKTSWVSPHKPRPDTCGGYQVNPQVRFSYLYTFVETQIGKEAHTHCHIKWVLQKKKKTIEAHSYRHFFFQNCHYNFFFIFPVTPAGYQEYICFKKEKILHPFSNVNDKATVWHTPCLFPKLPTLREGISLYLNILRSWGVHLLLKSGREISPSIKKEGFPSHSKKWV
jgi:hypothetical protein